MALSVVNKKIQKVLNDVGSIHDDLIVVEEPLEIKLTYFDSEFAKEKTISVTMRTPGNDFELAAGFLFSEGIIDSSKQIDQILYCKKALAEESENVVKVILQKNARPNLLGADRNFYISSSCGVCGKTSIDAIEQNTCFSFSFDFEISHKIIFDLLGKMKAKQVNFKYTGGIHACAIFDTDGNLMLVREDAGRHNALDKLIGCFVLKNELPLSKNILLLSGRISFELVQKAAMAGIPIVCGVGAPSSLAIETAEKLGITLIGFLKEKSMNIYTHQERISITANEDTA
jgi:FdhD protein